MKKHIISSFDKARYITDDIKKSSFAIIVATYNEKISEGLLSGALNAFKDCEIHNENINVFKTDGAFELPLLAKLCSNKFDAVICLGAVIKGDTAHFDYVAGECARGIQDVALTTSRPIIFGVLTTLNYEQASERANNDDLNKGRESVFTAIKTLHLSLDIKKI